MRIFRHLLAPIVLSLVFAIGVQAENLAISVKNGLLKGKIESPERCFIGDLNLISMEVNKDLESRRRVIATIEAISGSPDDFLGTSVNLTNRPGGLPEDALLPSFVLKLPQLKGKTVLAGFYVCKDGDNDSSCLNNKFDEFNEMVNVYKIPNSSIDPKTGKITDSKYLKTKKVSDKIYFFRPVVIKAGEVLVPSSQNASEYKELLGQYSQGNEASLKPVVDLSSKLASLPLGVTDNSLVVQLPRYVTKNCFNVSE